MLKKRFGLLHLIVAVAAAVSLSLLAAGCLLRARLGREGLSLLKGYLLVEERFVGDWDKTDAVDSALESMVDSLGDRWSHYLDADQYVAQQESRANQYVGIGCTVTYEREEGLLITRVEADSPAERGGLKAGEIMVSVDGLSVAEGSEHRTGNLTRGPEGSTVEVEILGEDGLTRTVALIRAQVVNEPVHREMLAGGIGYIRIEDFHSRSADGAIAAVEELKDQGAVGLIFDVRNNPGGYVPQLTRLLDALMRSGPIFISRDKAGRETVTRSDEAWVDLPMVVLVNGDSYSAAEFFAGALQEAGQARVVGQQTCGKGYSQQTFALPAGGAMAISTAEYFTGSGASFIGVGVTPDETVSLSEEAQKQLQAGTLPHDADAQLQAALALLS